ncbi:hypothetical protein HanIR_Chr11g0543491 [Helianthus annuus]|nr:hypothetical protein HanIR_Chr11g0543491 [Helianthus annuus]
MCGYNWTELNYGLGVAGGFLEGNSEACGRHRGGQGQLNHFGRLRRSKSL